jgi:hypothetical protein
MGSINDEEFVGYVKKYNSPINQTWRDNNVQGIRKVLDRATVSGPKLRKL